MPIMRSNLRWTTNCYSVICNNSYLQLWQSYAILSATTIICSKCPPLVETHAGWSHLIWHNFVKVADNWIKIYSLASTGTHNRHVKFGLKIPNRFGKNGRKPKGGWDFLTHTVHMWMRIYHLSKIFSVNNGFCTTLILNNCLGCVYLNI